jgi:hypothetical protein
MTDDRVPPRHAVEPRRSAAVCRRGERFGGLVGVLLGLVALVPLAARAETAVLPAFTSLQYQCVVSSGSNVSDDHEDSVSISAACDSTSSHGGFDHQAVASGQASVNPDLGFLGPHVNVAAELTIPMHPGLPPSQGTASMSGQVDYYFVVEQYAAPPFSQFEVPVVMTYAADTTGDANASVCFFGCITVQDGESASGTKTVLVQVNTQAQVHLAAGVFFFGGSLDGFSGGGQAVADPNFDFDQPAFDAVMGEFTFPLRSYYRLVFSEGVVSTNLIFYDGFELGHTERWGEPD